MSDFLMSLKDVSLAFGGPSVLDGVSLSVSKGIRAALTGRNGEGKSTLMKVIAGDLEPLEYMDAYEKGTPYRNDWDRIMKNSPKRVCYAHSGARDIAKYGIS